MMRSYVKLRTERQNLGFNADQLAVRIQPNRTENLFIELIEPAGCKRSHVIMNIGRLFDA